MHSSRRLVAVFMVVLATQSEALPVSAVPPEIGILTLATNARLNTAAASPGLSVFEGEVLSTEAHGRLGIRSAQGLLMLGPNTAIELISVTDGLPIDVSSGSVHFSTAAKQAMERHALDALVWPSGPKPTQASVTILGPNILQIAAARGDLNFSYRDEFRRLPEGQTYRIYLDPTGEAQSASVGQAPASISAAKLTIFIVAAGAGGTAAAWGIHQTLRSGNQAISPAKP